MMCFEEIKIRLKWMKIPLAVASQNRQVIFMKISMIEGKIIGIVTAIAKIILYSESNILFDDIRVPIWWQRLMAMNLFHFTETKRIGEANGTAVAAIIMPLIASMPLLTSDGWPIAAFAFFAACSVDISIGLFEGRRNWLAGTFL